MTKLIIDIVRFVLSLIEKACNGDSQALDKLKNFVPDDLQTELVKKVQDELDIKKFGSRPS